MLQECLKNKIIERKILLFIIFKVWLMEDRFIYFFPSVKWESLQTFLKDMENFLRNTSMLLEMLNLNSESLSLVTSPYALITSCIHFFFLFDFSILKRRYSALCIHFFFSLTSPFRSEDTFYFLFLYFFSFFKIIHYFFAL